MNQTKSKLWRPTPQYRQARRRSRQLNIELDSPAQREELKRRAAAEGKSVNRYVVDRLFVAENAETKK